MDTKNDDTQNDTQKPGSRTRISIKKPRALKHGYNMCTALISSLESERMAAMVELDPFTRISKRSEF